MPHRQAKSKKLSRSSPPTNPLKRSKSVGKFSAGGKLHWLTSEELAKILGASITSITSWCAQGMPFETEPPTGRDGRPRRRHDLTKTSDWLVANRKSGFGIPQLELPSHEPGLTGSVEPGLSGAVSRARAAECFGFQLLRDAIAKKDNFGIAATLENWRELGKVLADLERRHNDRDLLTAEIQEHTQQAVREWAEPIRAYIDTIRHAFAPRLLKLEKLADAEGVIDDLTSALLKQLSGPVTFKTESQDGKDGHNEKQMVGQTGS